MKVVIGLGNPGKEYERTRHNIGWMLLDALAARFGADRFRNEKTVDVAEARVNGAKVCLVKPKTYMNLSGQALSAWFGRFKEIRDALRAGPPEPVRPAALRRENARGKDGEDVCDWPGLLVAVDDVNLPLGRIRMRPSGSAGGHNGLKDLEKALGGRGYPRLRLGVGAPPEQMDRADYVLDRFASGEMPLVESMLKTATKAAEEWLADGSQAVMNKYNGVAVETPGQEGGGKRAEP